MSDAEHSMPFPLPILRESRPAPRPFRRLRAIGLHLVRILIVVAILALLRQQQQQRAALDAANRSPRVSLETVTGFLPDAVASSSFDIERGTQQFVDQAGNVVGFVVQTAPKSDSIIGFSGPTNVLLAFDVTDRVVAASILDSKDTREHVELIERDPKFLSSWIGLSWDEVVASLSGTQPVPGVDAVSGATLTSLAILESLAVRFSGSRPSLKFPEAISVDEVRALFPEAAALSEAKWNPAVSSVENADGGQLGFVLRTSPSADNTIGYQGPTDTLIGLDQDRRVIGIRLRSSFDNEPYVGYVRDEKYFLNLFNKRSLPDLAELDLFEARVEGVSGATMTSLAVAEGLIAAATATPVVETRDIIDQSAWLKIDDRNAGTVVIALLGLVVGFGPARVRRGIPRRMFQLVVIGCLGLLNGDLISIAVIVGWSSHAIPWEFAPGLVALTALSLLVPMTTREQLYCNHLCPHGALQQLLIKRIPWQLHPGRTTNRILEAVPLILLIAMATVVTWNLPVSLVDLEPFDAWLFKAAGAATLFVAVIGLMFSLLIPMAYCRFGCPTGALLSFLRFHGRSDQWQLRDTAAVVLLVIVFALPRL